MYVRSTPTEETPKGTRLHDPCELASSCRMENITVISGNGWRWLQFCQIPAAIPQSYPDELLEYPRCAQTGVM